MSQMLLTVTHTGQGNRMECKTPEGGLIVFDDAELGTTGGPVQHMLSAVGACALYDVNVILRKKRIEFSNLRVECHAQRRDEPYPRIITAVNLVFRVEGDVPQKAFEDAVKLSVDKYCSVAGTIAAGAPVTYDARVG